VGGSRLRMVQEQGPSLDRSDRAALVSCRVVALLRKGPYADAAKKAAEFGPQLRPRGQADSCIESLGTKVRFALSPAAWVPSLAPLNWPRDTQIRFFGPYG
jgi:hypothetical protein